MTHFVCQLSRMSPDLRFWLRLTVMTYHSIVSRILWARSFHAPFHLIYTTRGHNWHHDDFVSCIFNPVLMPDARCRIQMPEASFMPSCSISPKSLIYPKVYDLSNRNSTHTIFSLKWPLSNPPQSPFTKGGGLFPPIAVNLSRNRSGSGSLLVPPL